MVLTHHLDGFVVTFYKAKWRQECGGVVHHLAPTHIISLQYATNRRLQPVTTRANTRQIPRAVKTIDTSSFSCQRDETTFCLPVNTAQFHRATDGAGSILKHADQQLFSVYTVSVSTGNHELPPTVVNENTAVAFDYV